jgi:hypothetical protein
MENQKENIRHGMKKGTDAMQKTAETLSDTLIALVDKLAGKQSDIKLSFEDLTLETGVMKARINGAIVLDVVMAKDAVMKTETT